MPGFDEGGGWDVGLPGGITVDANGNIAARSFTATPNSPYAPTSDPGNITCLGIKTTDQFFLTPAAVGQNNDIKLFNANAHLRMLDSSGTHVLMDIGSTSGVAVNHAFGVHVAGDVLTANAGTSTMAFRADTTLRALQNNSYQHGFYIKNIFDTQTFTGLNIFGLYVDAPSFVKLGTGTIAQQYGVFVDAPMAAIATNQVAIAISVPTAGNWAFYSGITDPSYFGGRLSINAVLNVNGTGYTLPSATIKFQVDGTNVDVPLAIKNTAGAADAKYWDTLITANTLAFRATKDDYSNANNWLQVVRSGFTIASVSLYANGVTRFAVDTTGIGFFAAATVNQYATTGTATGFTAGAGTTVTHLSTFTGNTGATAYTIGDLVRAMKLYGLMAA